MPFAAFSFPVSVFFFCHSVCKFFGPVPHSLRVSHSVFINPRNVDIGIERKLIGGHYCYLGCSSKLSDNSGIKC